MGSFSAWHWIVVLVIVLIVFGAGRLPKVMGDLASGIKTFKKGMQDEDKPAEKPEPAKSIEHNGAPTASRSDVGSKAV